MAKIKVPLKKHFPQGFDPKNMEQVMALTVILQDFKASNPTYSEYDLYDYAPDLSAAIIAPANLDPEDKSSEMSRIKLTSSDCSGLAAQKSTVERYEAMTEYAGQRVIDFTLLPSGSYLMRMQPMDAGLIATREQFAKALNVKPWQIHVTRTVDHGYRIRWSEGQMTWNGDREQKMQTAVKIVSGKEGWFFNAYPLIRAITVHAGVPPTFAPTIPMPKEVATTPNLRRSYFGMKLPDHGRSTGDELYNDWKDSPFVLVCGESGGGKSVVINSLIYGRIAAGAELYIGDEKGKSIDYNWCRDYVADNGWGCDGLESTAAMLLYILEECQRRANLLDEHGVGNWWELPEDVRPPAIFLAMDEISQLDVVSKVPTGLDKDNPDVVRKKYENNLKFSIQESMTKILQTARFVGVTAVYAAQSAKEQAGVTTLMRDNLGGKIIVGEKVPQATRDSVLKDSKHAPVVPLNVIKQGRGKGTGIAELTGQEACVYKGYFESYDGKTWPDILYERANKLRPVTPNPEAGHLSRETIIRLCPSAFSVEFEDTPTGGGEPVVQIEPVQLQDANGNVINSADMAAAVGL